MQTFDVKPSIKNNNDSSIIVQDNDNYPTNLTNNHNDTAYNFNSIEGGYSTAYRSKSQLRNKPTYNLEEFF